jgi:hypothetical protein
MGKLLHPTFDTIRRTLVPAEDNLDGDKRKDHTLKAVGSLSLRDSRLTGLLSIPKDALTPILQMSIAGRFKFVDMDAATLRYREALVRSFRLETQSTRTTCDRQMARLERLPNAPRSEDAALELDSYDPNACHRICHRTSVPTRLRRIELA